MTNTLYPGRPDYIGPTSGLYLLMHHDQLIEWSGDVNERLSYIRTEKLKHEVATRLHDICYLAPSEDMSWIAESNLVLDESRRLRAESRRLRVESDRLWAEGSRLGREADRLLDEGDLLHIESNRLQREGNRLQREGDRLRREGDRLLDEHRGDALAELRRLVPDTAWDEKRGRMFFNK